jgi:hypothetical protein
MRARRRFSACRHFCSSSNQLLSWRSLPLEIEHLIEHWMTRSASFSASNGSAIPQVLRFEHDSSSKGGVDFQCYLLDTDDPEYFSPAVFAKVHLEFRELNWDPTTGQKRTAYFASVRMQYASCRNTSDRPGLFSSKKTRPDLWTFLAKTLNDQPK